MKSLRLSFPLYIVVAIVFFLNNIKTFAQEIKPQTQNKRAYYYFKTGQKMMDNGLFEKAEALLTESIELRPAYLEAWNLRATCRERLGRLDAAIRDYNQILKMEPNRYDALFSRSILFYETERYPLAIEGFDQLLQTPKGETQAVYFKGKSLNPSEETTMEGIVSLNTEQGEIYHYRGLAKWKLNYLDGAIEDFTLAVEANSQQPDYFVNRGLVYMKKKDMKAAIADMQSALELDPENTLALYNLSLASKNHNAALKALDEVVNLEDGFPTAYANRAYAHLEIGDYRAAINDYDTAIMLDKTQPEFFSNRGIAHKKARNYKRAIRDFSQAIVLAPSWGKNYSLRGETYFKLTEFDKAIEDFTAALAYDSNNGNYYFNRALAYRRVGENEKCCQDLQIASRLGMRQAIRAMNAYCNE